MFNPGRETKKSQKIVINMEIIQDKTGVYILASLKNFPL